MDEDSDKILTARIDQYVAGLSWWQRTWLLMLYTPDGRMALAFLVVVALWGVGTGRFG